MLKKELAYSKVKNSLNYDYHEHEGEINLYPSLTVPDQALSLKEIIRRFASGIPMDIGKIPIFDEDNDLPDFRKLDLAEREEWKIKFQEELEQFKQDNWEAHQEKVRAAQEKKAADEAALMAKRAENQKNDTKLD